MVLPKSWTWLVTKQTLFFPWTLVVVQLLSCIQLFAISWTAAHQASLSFAISWSLLQLVSIESVMPSNHLILCCPLLLLPSIFPSVRVVSNESEMTHVTKVWELPLQHQFFQWIFDYLELYISSFDISKGVAPFSYSLKLLCLVYILCKIYLFTEDLVADLSFVSMLGKRY